MIKKNEFQNKKKNVELLCKDSKYLLIYLKKKKKKT